MIYSDNRTFVWTCAIMKNGAETLNTCYGNDSKLEIPGNYRRWVSLLNVDPLSWENTSDFERNWADERTYKRWVHYGTFNGFSYHSGAMIASNCRNPELWKNFGAMYFDQMLLLLYLRVSLFRFSVELNKITSKAIKNGDNGQKEWGKQFQELRWSFSLFANLYQFPLLSNQQQGLEMYTIQRKYMEIDDLFKEIKEEIQNSYEYLVVKQDQEQTEQGERLNVVATIGLVGALAFSFLGMNVIIKDTCDFKNWSSLKAWLILFATVGVFLVITILILLFSKLLSRYFNKLARYREKKLKKAEKLSRGI